MQISLKKNIAANYASQFYVTLIGIIVVPLYLKYMGAEAYGLVGFFAMLQALFNLLDMGITPTISRETARFRGGGLTTMHYRKLLRTLESIFFGVAVFGGIALLVYSEAIALRWLNATHLPPNDITFSIKLMGVAVALRWMSGFYRGVISGSERLVWLGGFNAVIATLRFVFVLPLLIFWDASTHIFFSYQLVIALFECLCVGWMAYQLTPPSNGQCIEWSWKLLGPQLKFSLAIAFTSSVWVLVTQTDKLLLSKVLSLADYGYFTVAVMLAGGISIVGGPVGNAVTPRMVHLQAQNNEPELIFLYRKATQMVIAVATPVALILTIFPAQVLWAWTGNSDLMYKAAPVLSLYAAGFGILVASAFPYCLQYAKGDLRIHFIGNIVYATVLVPLVFYAATNYGAVGAGWAWLISNGLGFLLITPLVHKRFAPGLHINWVLNDVLRVGIPSLMITCFSSLWITWSDSRIILGAELVITGCILFLVCLSMTSFINTGQIIKYIHPKKHDFQALASLMFEYRNKFKFFNRKK